MAALISFIMLCAALVASPLLIAIGGGIVVRLDDRDIEMKKSKTH